MDDLIFLGVVFIFFFLAVDICLHIWLGKKRNHEVLIDIRTVLNGINSMEKSANSRDRTLRSLISNYYCPLKLFDSKKKIRLNLRLGGPAFWLSLFLQQN